MTGSAPQVGRIVCLFFNMDRMVGRDPAAFAPVFRDFQGMYIDHFRFRSIGAMLSSRTVDTGLVFVGSLDGRLYALH